MAEFNMGYIALFPSEHTPKGWASCDGQTMSTSNNMALYTIIGANYGGNGRDTFGLPSSEELPDIGGCRHIICIKGVFSRGETLPYIEASARDNERVIGFKYE